MLNLSFNFLNNIKSYIFPFYRKKDLKFIFKKLQEGIPKNKVAARFVGGCVRKHLTNKKTAKAALKRIKQKFPNYWSTLAKTI